MTVTLRVDDGWHVNANPASTEFLIATIVDVRGVPAQGEGGKGGTAPAVEVLGVTYPKPSTLKADGLGAGAINVYGGTVTIAAKVRLSADVGGAGGAGKTIALRVLAKFQACSDDGTCLAPSDWSTEVSVGIALAR